ncbi:MAG: histidine phosphatase family protein [Armatimonadota bacterium]|nr:histidine phosphatase family protein [Armatimonadota bacterium]
MGRTRIYLLRHGETTWNAEQRYQGRLDAPLTAAGREQSARAGDALRDVTLAAVYSSPLGRALETARIVAEAQGLAVVPREGLHEISLGVWEGLTVAEVAERYGEALRQWRTAPHLAQIPGAETLQAVQHRAAAALDEIRRRHRGEAAAVVAHGGVNKLLLLALLGAPVSAYWRIRQHNGCINVLEFDGERGWMRIMNETAHLERRPAAEASGRRARPAGSG